MLELGLTLSDLEYFEQSTLFIVGADTGISRDLSDHMAIGAEIGLRYQPKLSPAPILGARVSRTSTTPAADGRCPSASFHMAVLMTRAHRRAFGAWRARWRCLLAAPPSRRPQGQDAPRHHSQLTADVNSPETKVRRRP